MKRAAVVRGGVLAGGARSAASQSWGVGPSVSRRWRMLWLRLPLWSFVLRGQPRRLAAEAVTHGNRPLRRLPGRACLPVSGALLFWPPLDGFCLRNAASPHDARYESGAPNSWDSAGGITDGAQTGRKVRLLKLSMPRRSGFLSSAWTTVREIERVRPTGINILFLTIAC